MGHGFLAREAASVWLDIRRTPVLPKAVLSVLLGGTNQTRAVLSVGSVLLTARLCSRAVWSVGAVMATTGVTKMTRVSRAPDLPPGLGMLQLPSCPLTL